MPQRQSASQDILGWDIVGQIDHFNLRINSENHALHDSDEGILQAEVCRQRDQHEQIVRFLANLSKKSADRKAGRAGQQVKIYIELSLAAGNPKVAQPPDFFVRRLEKIRQSGEVSILAH